MSRRAYRDFLEDMLVHAQDAVACVEGRTLEEVVVDRLRRLALERRFEVLGEAAGKVPPEIRARYPELPWAEMIAVRNRVARLLRGGPGDPVPDGARGAAAAPPCARAARVLAEVTAAESGEPGG